MQRFSTTYVTSYPENSTAVVSFRCNITVDCRLNLKNNTYTNSPLMPQTFIWSYS